MIDCHTGDWARDMLAELGLPTNILGRTTPPGTTIGTLRAKIAEETGLPKSLRVVAPAAHDTASAVAAVPSEPSTNWCYLSSGTWSLLGAELSKPCVTAAAQAASFTNELGINDTFRFLKNIAGLWLVQECRRDFKRQGQEFDYVTLTKLASDAAPLRTIVDPAHPSFQTPGGMPEKSPTSPAAQANRCHLHPASSFAPRSKVSPSLIAKSWPRSNRSWSSVSTRFISSAAAARIRCSTK